MMHLKFQVNEEYSGRKIKSILKNKFEFSEKLIKKLKRNRRIFCNDTPVFVNYVVSIGDVIEVFLDFDEESENVIPEKMDLDIIYEDECLIAINKQPDSVVHPTCSHPTGTIANGLMYHFLQKGLKTKIRPVSRLDRGTSGVIIFAKNQFVQEYLIQQMKRNEFQKGYVGIVHGNVKSKSGTIDLPIDRKPGSIMLRHVSETGYKSVTHYSVIEYLNNATLLKFFLETGRTHQIRVHCQAIGHPLIGDTLYSNVKTELIGRQALHSYKAEFIHPFTKEKMNLLCPISPDIINLLEIMRK